MPPGDVENIRLLAERVYSANMAYTCDMIRGRFRTTPKGNLLLCLKTKLWAIVLPFVSMRTKLSPHTRKEITAGGFAANHDHDGDYLYGMEAV